MAKLRLMKQGHGDICLAEWSETDTTSIDIARQEFLANYLPGRLAFRVDGPGDQTLLREFDATAREILLVPAIRGG